MYIYIYILYDFLQIDGADDDEKQERAAGGGGGGCILYIYICIYIYIYAKNLILVHFFQNVWSTKIQLFGLQCLLFCSSDSRNGCGIARSIGYTPGFVAKTRAKASYEGFPFFSVRRR